MYNWKRKEEKKKKKERESFLAVLSFFPYSNKYRIFISVIAFTWKCGGVCGRNSNQSPCDIKGRWEMSKPHSFLIFYAFANLESCGCIACYSQMNLVLLQRFSLFSFIHTYQHRCIYMYSYSDENKDHKRWLNQIWPHIMEFLIHQTDPL